MKKLKKDSRGRAIIEDAYYPVTLDDLLPGDILLLLNGNKLTEWHGRTRRKGFGRSDSPPYHAAIYFGELNGKHVILDPTLQTGLSPIDRYLTQTKKRLDVVRVDASDTTRKEVKRNIWELAVQSGWYDGRGYLYFIKQMPYLGWLPVPQGSKKLFFCSDAVAYCWEKAGVHVSPRGHNKSAPVDLQLYGLKHHEMLTLKKTGE